MSGCRATCFPSWSGRAAALLLGWLVCCQGKIPTLTKVKVPPPLPVPTLAQVNAMDCPPSTFPRIYLHTLMAHKHVLGWMSRWTPLIVAAVSDLQRSLGVKGSVGEIGVYKGLFLTALTLLKSPDERVFSCDIYSKGLGGLSPLRVKSLLQYHKANASGMVVYPKSSADLTPVDFVRSRLTPLRLLSIDGNHTADGVFNDLRLAAQISQPGTVVVVDDFHSPAWLSVDEGVYRFLADLRYKDSFAPFLLACNKLYLTTPSHHETMLASVQKLKDLKWMDIRDLLNVSLHLSL
eukprot:TRINITY_DN56256_c0_g1_i3.p1 TRINITY_DN56256_c0_g1~~TRINITY_DN56256_c0_g1_i3.p1  ORF type:complete len:305 (-),score=21.55 TRINITY_DN56256_c0_g1_i3:95-970(-)